MSLIESLQQKIDILETLAKLVASGEVKSRILDNGKVGYWVNEDEYYDNCCMGMHKK